MLEPYDQGNQFYLEKTLKIVQCCPTYADFICVVHCFSGKGDVIIWLSKHGFI